MLGEDRLQKIKSLINEKGSVSIADLVDKFHVTNMTIHRDLKKLEEQGILEKVYGGAVLIKTKDNISYIYDKNWTTSTLQMQYIARYSSVNYVRDNMTVILDSAPIILEMIPHLTQRNLTLFTNSIHILLESSQYIPHFSVIGCGGDMDEKSMAFTGEVAQKFFSQIKRTVDICFISGDAFSKESGLTSFNKDAAIIANTMINHSKKTIILIESHKFEKVAKYSVAPLNKIDLVITDENISQDCLKSFMIDGVVVQLATKKWFENLHSSILAKRKIT